MSKATKKPFLNRKETQTLLNALKVTTIIGITSMTIAGWGLLAQIDAGGVNQAAIKQNPAVTILASGDESIQSATSSPKPASAAANQRVKKLNIVQWLQNRAGEQIAVVSDIRGNLWYVMGSDIARIEQGLSPLVRPQLVQRVVTRSRAS